MVNIDVKTLFIFSAAANIFIIALFAIYIRIYKEKNPIIDIFVLSRVLGILFLIILSLRDGLPSHLSIIINSTIYLFLVYYELYCISFIDRKFNFRHFKQYLLIPLILSIIAYFFITSSESHRIVIMSLNVAIMYIISSYILLTAKGKTKIQYLTGYMFTIISLLILTRSFGALKINGVEMYSMNYVMVIPVIFYLTLNLIFPLLLIFILKEKDNLKLRELNKSKNKFFSIIAHDLRGPLGGLQQIGELLWLNNINDEVREKLTKTLYQNSKNTFNLLDNLLKWANANAGLIVCKPTNLNIQEIIANNIHLFKSQIKLKNLSLNCNFKNDLFVYADSNMIDTVIRNLISNSIKFTPDDGEIEIDLDKIDETNNTCTIVIIDNGVGLDKETQLKVFELNSTVSTYGTNKEKGTGLGLKLCKEFLTLNNGNIRVKSNVKNGTRVYVSLPLSTYKTAI
ncbi:sensor histidine kinase [Lutibacter citreus]|uniref:sensor histidine kinase n=1 Tax=Lutibacter citreus TaxID=2138210 RepID=UPI000DBE13E3|nr:HAMP domain-containing sensor histidine kinase [Lutibacter citreus]